MKITLENLSLTLGKQKILNNLNLTIPSVKLIMLLGNNGVGKTQLIKTIIGFQKPTLGKIYYGDKDLDQITFKNRAKLISYVPQITQSDLGYSVEDFIALGLIPNLSFFNKPSPEMVEQIHLAMDKLEISYLKNRFTNELSGGELRLVYLARALTQGTPWLFLDEPTSSLDFSKEHQFLKLLKNIVAKEKKSILMSIHNPSMAYDYADIIIMMKDGEILDIIDLHCDENNSLFEERLQALYGANIKFEKTTTNSKVLVWKENIDGFH